MARSVAAAVVVSCIVAAATADDVEPCAPAGRVAPICGLHHPEDLDVLPGGRLVLVSEYGGVDGSKPGALSTFRPADGAVVTLYPSTEAADSAERWGDPACPGPPGPAFDPHGIHHAVEAGADVVHVVNHGGREAVELFEIDYDEDAGTASVTWRGCVVAPANAWFNDVAGLPGGGFVATHMMPRDTTRDRLMETERTKAPTGYVLEWHETTGWRRVAGTDGALPNGIEVSPDGAVLYVNYHLGDRVAAIRRESGETLWAVDVPGPDNTSITADGRLLVAALESSLDDILRCAESAAGNCPLPYTIFDIDPATGDAQALLRGGDAVFGGATVAVRIGRELLLGSFHGDRMARVRLD